MAKLRNHSLSLKLKYFAGVIQYAGYVIDSIEIAFIVKKQNMPDFRVLSSKVNRHGLLLTEVEAAKAEAVLKVEELTADRDQWMSKASIAKAEADEKEASLEELWASNDSYALFK